MDNRDLLKLVDLLEKESSVRIASEVARAAENANFQQTNSDMQASFSQTIRDLNATIGQLNETIGNSSIPPSKDENRPQRTSSLRGSRGKSSGGQKGHEGSTLKMSATPDHIIEHQPWFCNCCGLDLEDQQGNLPSAVRWLIFLWFAHLIPNTVFSVKAAPAAISPAALFLQG
ncbi:MAG TPA: hypothetical protein VGC08_03835 [Pedobacter sp.]